MTTAAEGAFAAMSPHGARAAALTDAGNVRDHNEDAFVLVPELDLYVVSDGMGGHAGGETASRIVVETLPEVLGVRLTAGGMTEEHRREVMRATLLELSRRVREEAERRVGLTGMGATVVAAAVHDAAVTIAHMGDSRAYRFSGAGLNQVTDDHSIVGILLRRGEITADEAKEHPARGRITRYVGTEDDIDPDVTTVDFEPGERLLLCSDGLSGVVSDEDVAGVLGDTAGVPEVACRRLMDAALAGDAPDNITVLVVDRMPLNADSGHGATDIHKE